MTEEAFYNALNDTLQEPNPKKAFYDLCDLYLLAANEDQRRWIREEVIGQRQWEPPDLKMLAAHLPDEPPREARIRAAIFALSFWTNADWREDLVLIALIHDSLKAIGKNADTWLRYFADLSAPVIASLLSSFAERKPEDQSLEKWGWKSEVTQQGLVYQWK